MGEKIRFYKSGDLVRDVGIVYFYKILKKIADFESLEIRLQRNYLEVDKLEINVLTDYIMNVVLFESFKNGNKKLKDIIFRISKDNLKDYPNKFFNYALKENIISEKEKKKLNEDWGKKLFPYVRNSPKYGANSYSNKDTDKKANCRQNIKELIDISFEMAKGEIKKLSKYVLKDNICNVCNISPTTIYDITHKENEKKLRQVSKYNYSFMGASSSSFNNYCKDENNICFLCEFFNLMYMLYINIERPVVIAYIDNLKELEYFNYKIMLNQKLYKEKSFFRKIASEVKGKIKLYNIKIDTNKGLILEFTNVLDISKLLKQFDFISIIENYKFPNNSNTYRKILKRNVFNENEYTCLNVLLGNILGNSKNEKDFTKNTSLYCEFLKKGGFVDLNNYILENFRKLGKELNNKYFEEEKLKRNISFRIIQMLKSGKREDLFTELTHLIISKEIEIPKYFTEIIFKSDEMNLHYSIGVFLEEFLKETNIK